jgi:hypothetical protein
MINTHKFFSSNDVILEKVLDRFFDGGRWRIDDQILDSICFDHRLCTKDLAVNLGVSLLEIQIIQVVVDKKRREFREATPD